jgi:hypothetical protein
MLKNRNLGPGLGQTCNCDKVKLGNEIPILPSK